MATVAPGMSLRDWFAGQALLAISVAVYGLDRGLPIPPKVLAEGAYNIADDMLKERERKP